MGIYVFKGELVGVEVVGGFQHEVHRLLAGLRTAEALPTLVSEVSVDQVLHGEGTR
jgi:hypothetical protein